MASSKRQTTMAKIAREQAVREKRARKQEKKDDRKQAAADALLEPVSELDGDIAELDGDIAELAADAAPDGEQPLGDPS